MKVLGSHQIRVFIKYCGLLTATACFVISCVSSQFVVTDEDVIKANKRDPDITYYDLNNGRKLYVLKCSGCHLLHKPSELTKAQWMGIIPDMQEEAKLTDEETELIRQYLLVKATGI